LKPDSDVRSLWEKRDHVTRLPTVLLIDSKGILRFELFSDSGKVEDKVAELISQSKATNAETEGK
jgi:hypothetical protein